MMKIKMIKDYQFESVLGEGGMAVVYLAEHQLFHSKVAVKVLNREFVHNENIRKRFISEARNMFKMSHPNIVRVIDMVDDGETVAFVMEYIEGESLKEFIDRKGKLGDEQIQYIMLQMLDALEYVHSQGLVHRDIKPSNFMLTPQGKVKLMDFGIAKQLNPGSPEYTSTGTNQQMGTAMYMSPEQVKSTKDVTLGTDIYSLGVVLWQMVSGRRPYNQSELSIPEIQVSIIKEPLPSTGTKWDAVIQKATEKEVEKRYRDAKEFKEALRGAEKGKAQEKTIIEEKTTYEPKVSSPNINSVPQGSATTTQKKSNPIGIIIGIALILGIGYLIWNGNNGPTIEESLTTEIQSDEKHLVTRDLYSPEEVKIGNQIWMKRNLDVDRFRNGDEIPQVQSHAEWEKAGREGRPAWCYYEYNLSYGDKYGKLYNWYAVSDPRGLAPVGWHVPSYDEWNNLNDFLGDDKKMRAKLGWKEFSNGTNSSGFSALPGGVRDWGGFFYGIGSSTSWWSSTDRGNGYADNYQSTDDYDFIVSPSKGVGASVRCLRD